MLRACTRSPEKHKKIIPVLQATNWQTSKIKLELTLLYLIGHIWRLLSYLLYVSIFLIVLPTPQESFSVAAQSGRRPPAPITGATQERSGDLSISSSLSLTALEEFPLLGAVSSQIAITKPTYNTTSPVWISNGASGASFSEVLSAARPAIVPSQIAEGEAVSNTQRSTAHIPRNAFSSTCPTRPDTPTQIIGAGIISTERVLTNNLENIGPSSRVTHSNVSGRSTPVQSVGNSIIRTSKVLQSGVLNDSRKTPDNVFVVCDDFLEKHRRRPASIYEKIKACKGCENRSKLRYAVWSDNSKEWQVIRPYPIEKVPANVAFSVCRQYALKVPCLWSACSFAHGQEELLMWTMEREGGKFAKFTARHYRHQNHCILE